MRSGFPCGFLCPPRTGQSVLSSRPAVLLRPHALPHPRYIPFSKVPLSVRTAGKGRKEGRRKGRKGMEEGRERRKDGKEEKERKGRGRDRRKEEGEIEERAGKERRREGRERKGKKEGRGKERKGGRQAGPCSLLRLRSPDPGCSAAS